MGTLLKLGVIATVLVVSYILATAIWVFVNLFASYLQLNSAPSASYAAATGDLLAALITTVVLVFFTIPAILAAFGHAGAWLKHVVLKVGKGLLVAFMISTLAYYAAFAASAVRVSPSFTSAIGPLAILGLASLLVVGLTRGGVVLRLVEELIGTSLGLASRLPGAIGKHDSAAAVELHLTTTRQTRTKSDERIVQEETIRSLRFARNLASLGCTTELKLSFRGRRGRVLVLARGREDRAVLESRLLSVVKTYLPEARPAPSTVPAEASRMASIHLLGAPEITPNPLEPLARFFIENGLEGDYAVVLRSHRSNPASTFIARRTQRRLAMDSASQWSTQSVTGDQLSKTVQDQLVNLELEEAAKEVERQASPRAVEAWVYVTGIGRTISEALKVAESASMVVRASLSSHRRERELKLCRQRKPFQDLRPRGSPSVILPYEAAPLVWIPQMAIGMEIAPAMEFELPPPLEGEIELGEVVLPSGGSGHLAKLALDDLARHLFLTGMTGSGKTTSSFNLLIQLYRLGVPFLVIEPVKSEYRSLSTCVQGLQVFTVGDEDTAPFRLNIFEPPNGVKIQTHVENLEAAWNASFVMYAPLPYVVKQVLHETYKACGWDVGKNVRGKPITLDDCEIVAQRVSRGLGYEPKVTMDIEAALRARITSLSLGSKRPVFNTVASIPTETILRRPTVIELKNVANSEEKAFVALMILSNLAEYLEARGQSKQLKHFTLIEEAHRLLPNISTAKGDPESADPRKTMVEQFANMLAEVRAYGEGLALVEQIPTKILPDAIKNTATKVAHRVPAGDDREVLAGAMNLTQEQMSVFGALRPGEAIIHVQKHPLPIKILVPNVTQKLGLPIGEVGDVEVKRYMADFYLRNPLPRAPQSVLTEKLLQMVEAEWFKTKFQDAYNEWVGTGSTETLTTLLIQSATKVSGDREETLLNASKLLKLACERHLRFDLEKNEFPATFMRSFTKSMRNAKRAG